MSERAGDWSLLADWLNADCLALREPEGRTYHQGLYEARAEVAEYLRDLPADLSAEERLGQLYEFLARCVMGEPERETIDA